MKEMPVVKFRILREGARVFGYGSAKAAGFDLCALLEDGQKKVVLFPHQTMVIGTGLAIELPEDHAGLVCPRSGLAANEDITVLNAPGVIDEDYRGEIKVILHNAGGHLREIKSGDRIAQMLIQPVERCRLQIVEILGETERGEGGLGSTGKQ